uniref:Uncharacterized protein n=1 Tax=Romanomermis culicivorax TaxID=13658 RepID=A0A915KQX0_ROMCU
MRVKTAAQHGTQPAVSGRRVSCWPLTWLHCQQSGHKIFGAEAYIAPILEKMNPLFCFIFFCDSNLHRKAALFKEANQAIGILHNKSSQIVHF